MRYVVAFARFWYDFIIGDDWRIAAGVTFVLAIGAAAILLGLRGEGLALAIGAGLVVVFVVPILRLRRA